MNPNCVQAQPAPTSAGRKGPPPCPQPCVSPMRSDRRRATQLRALDLFCGAGGATKGLQRAGFHVTGVDINPQPRYCGDAFIQADIAQLVAEYYEPGADLIELCQFDLVWASPPCQKFTALQNRNKNSDAHDDHIGYVRAWLDAEAHDYAIENVEGAPLLDPVTLCGCMFDLGAQGCRLQRRRGFEASFPVQQPMCFHDARPVIGIYGGHARRRAASAGGRGTKDVWVGGHRAAASEALGIDWMTLTELSESIPPAYSEYIARAYLAQHDKNNTLPGGVLADSDNQGTRHGNRPSPVFDGRSDHSGPAVADG